MSGFITMQREVLEHPLFMGDSARLGAWFWMIAKACWKETRFNVHGKTITLQRGQFCCSVRDLAENWGWSKSSVERFLTRLKTETMIETDAGTGRLIISICNYATYQDFGKEGGTPPETPTGTAAGQQRDIKEQGNKGTIEEDSPPTPPEDAPEPERKSVPVKKIDLPEWLSRDLWHRWVSHRRSLRRDITTNTAAMIVAHLDQLRLEGHDPIATINHSIMRGLIEFEPPPPPPTPPENPRRNDRVQPPSPRRRRDNDEPASPLIRAAIELQADRAARHE